MEPFAERDYEPIQPRGTDWRGFLRKIFAPVAFAIGLIAKLGALAKFAAVFVAFGGYALIWGWRFALGVVVLIFVHELGHYLEASREGLNPQWPVFVPFLGAYVKHTRGNPWQTARVAIAGPILGGAAALVCFAIGQAQNSDLLTALGYFGFVLNLILLSVASRSAMDPLNFPDRMAESALALVGVSGSAVFHSMWLEDLSAAIGVLFSIAAVLVSAYFLLRSAEPAPELSDDEVARLRRLLDEHGERDSLGYFALRRDKFAVFSRTGKAAVTYRVIAGVALCSADPLGDHEAWPGAIEEYLEVCRRNAWVPAAMGTSELGATVWARFGLEVLEIGDEAVVDVDGFTLEGRVMRGVRQAVSRTKRAGYKVLVRRAENLRPGELDELIALAANWRGTDTERGFSMALGRIGDPGSMLVTAEQGGRVRGVLQFVPWGAAGLSLDVMRRDRTADNGVNELMISELLVAAPRHDIQHVSLNFAAFRALMEQGRRIGAGPVARLSAKVLHFFSRWIQIETLYRFNAKFQPRWVPRYLAYPSIRELPRVGIATFEAEGLGGRSPRLLRLLRRA